MTGSLLQRNVQPRIVQPQQKQRQVHSVLTAAEPVPPSLVCRVTCVHIDPSTAQLNSSATSSSTLTDFSSSSSSNSVTGQTVQLCKTVYAVDKYPSILESTMITKCFAGDVRDDKNDAVQSSDIHGHDAAADVCQVRHS